MNVEQADNWLAKAAKEAKAGSIEKIWQAMVWAKEPWTVASLARATGASPDFIADYIEVLDAFNKVRVSGERRIKPSWFAWLFLGAREHIEPVFMLGASRPIYAETVAVLPSNGAAIVDEEPFPLREG